MTKYIEIELVNGRVDVFMVVGEGDNERHIPHLYNAEPGCDHKLEGKLAGGMVCTKCNGWCCL